MLLRPRTRAPYGAREYVTWRGSARVKWWWRGRWRGISLPTWELFVFDRGMPRLVGRGVERLMPTRPVKPNSNGVLPGAKAGAWAATLPHLSEWLTSAAWADGEPIGPVQLQLRREGTVIRATLKVSDQGGLKCSAIEETPLDALLALDILLSVIEVPWEVDPYPLGGGPKKRK